MSRHLGVDRALLAVIAMLILFGLAVLYSAGQTDVPSFAAVGAWKRQIIWLVGGGLVAFAAFRISPRLL